MRSKTYWGKTKRSSDPFQLSKRVARRITEVISRRTREIPLKFLWIYINEDGTPSANSADSKQILNLDEWLNVVDEAASLGVDSVIAHVGNSFSAWPDLWSLCQWAQQTHGLQIGFHYTGESPTDEELEQVTSLTPALTSVFLGTPESPARGIFESAGIRVATATVCKDDIKFPCHEPEQIACVDTAGKLYSCGLVLGDQRYSLGIAQQNTLSSVLSDDTLPHEVTTPAEHTMGQCDGCPSRLFDRLSK